MPGKATREAFNEAIRLLLAELYEVDAEGTERLRKNISGKRYDMNRSLRYNAQLSLCHRLDGLKIIRDNPSNIAPENEAIYAIVDKHLEGLQSFRTKPNAEFVYCNW